MTRRAALAAVAVAGLGGCGRSGRPRAAAPASPSASRSAAPAVDPARFVALEQRYGARLGVYAVATGGGASVAYRADERFAFCSTFKPLAVAGVLARNPLSYLDTRVTYTAADVDSISPVTEKHVDTGMTVRELCDAAIRYSDGTAGNLLVRALGGPATFTAYLRTLGDSTGRLNDYEPELNRHPQSDPRDTTTPRALAAVYRRLVLGDALPATQRSLLTGWLENTVTTAARIPAALPKSWKLAHKTGTGDYGRAHDVAIAWPPGTPPLVIAVLTDRPGYDTPPTEPLLTDATTLLVPALT